MTGLWMIFGNLRSGKTAFATWLAHEHKKHSTYIISNYSMTFADYTAPSEILIMKLKHLIEEHEKVTVVIDDLWVLMDSRDSASGENKFASDVMINSGKDGITIIGTSQMPHMVDKRYRDIADYRVLCERKGKTRDRNATIKAHITTMNFKAKKGISLKTQRFKVHEVCDLYDTKEKIERNRRLKMKLWAAIIKEEDQETYQELAGCETLTEQRELLQTYQGVKRAEQVALLKQLGLR